MGLIPRVVRDEKGWKVKSSWLTFHPVSYGVGTLARLSVGSSSGAAVMLHYFPKHTPGPEMHDHPWPFVTLMLWGGYTDHSVDAAGYHVDDLYAGSLRFRPARHRHRTVVWQPTVTIVLRGRVERGWCEGTPEDWKCEGRPADFTEKLGSA